MERRHNQRCDREQISVQPGRSQQEGDEVVRSRRRGGGMARMPRKIRAVRVGRTTGRGRHASIGYQQTLTVRRLNQTNANPTGIPR